MEAVEGYYGYVPVSTFAAAAECEGGVLLPAERGPEFRRLISPPVGGFIILAGLLSGEDVKMGKMVWAILVLVALMQPGRAGPRLSIGFVSIPAGTSFATCSAAAKSALDPFFGNAHIQGRGGHAFDARFTAIVYCDMDVHQAYVLIGGNESDSTLRAVDELKNQIKTRLTQTMPGARPL